MWSWILHHVDLLNFIVLTATLVAVVCYTRAAFRQAEGFLRPCLVPDFHAERVGEREMRTVDQATTLYEMGDPMLVIRNIGSGPALNVRYRSTPVEIPKSLDLDLENSLPAAPVGANAFARTGQAQRSLPDPLLFVAEYRSLSGRKYSTIAMVRERKNVTALGVGRRWWWSRLKRYYYFRPLRKKYSSQGPKS